MNILDEKLKFLPDKPGVYIFKNSQKNIIYVGKAKILKNRVRNYFQNIKNHSPKVIAMIKNIADLDFIVTDSEIEALILESDLIKKFKPKYNISLKDDKNYPFLKISNEKFPRISVTHKKIDDGAKYFGPYTNFIKENLRLLLNIFPLRTCKNFQKRPCLKFHIKKCPAPCANKISAENYSEIVELAEKFLSGKTAEVEKNLNEKMLAAAENLDFESAAKFRDILFSIKKFAEKQKIILKLSKIPAVSEEFTALEELQKFLNLPTLPIKIECFDISHFQGAETVASMVSFRNGNADKKNYRRFKIKSTEGKPDDFLSMREVILRRYKNLEKFPDLIVIDGGIGQLNSALEIIRGLNLKIPVISLAKKFELVFTENNLEPIKLEGQALHLLQKIRDEAHRFAINYHRKLRWKRNLQSELDEIYGIGKKRRENLLKKFGTTEKIKSATFEEILEVEGMNKKSAENIKKYFSTEKL